jgi:hypothetical protein
MKNIDEIDAAKKIQFTAESSCLPAGVPVFLLNRGPFYFIQIPPKVIILEEQSQQARHIYLNVPHSSNVEPSWFGDSIGRYQGNTLFIDTIGFNTKTSSILSARRIPKHCT